MHNALNHVDSYARATSDTTGLLWGALQCATSALLCEARVCSCCVVGPLLRPWSLAVAVVIIVES